jgi:glutathione synthase/RimK-type ligase-like ATP-grasp enzyme
MKYNLAILKNESDGDHIPWEISCNKHKDKLDCTLIDLTKSDWLRQVNSENFDIFLTRPPDKTSYFKQLYDERLFIINKVLGYKIYPSLEENLIYENKRMLAYWLQSKNIPHPDTYIFYHKNEALEFAGKCMYPVVSKSSIGASGTGIRILHNKDSLVKHINKVFSSKGIKRDWGINLRKESIFKRGIKAIFNFNTYYKKLTTRYNASYSDPQNWYLILQEYVKCEYEWRAVKIGDSYFAHKKLASKGEKFSGTSKVGWDGPSISLLNFVKDVCEKGNLASQAVDIFEPKPDIFLVNELQCFFGSKNPHQMILEGKPGRYRCINSEWIFEAGNFNTNNSYDLRLESALKMLSK